MKNDILINDVIRKVDGLLLDFNYYYTIKNTTPEPKNINR